MPVALAVDPRHGCFGRQIEHFVDPKDKKHAKFASVADKELILFGRVRAKHNNVAALQYWAPELFNL